MPTAIDEFRILDDGTYLHPCLTPRWKLYSGELVFTLPDSRSSGRPFESYEDYEVRGLPSIFDPPVDQSGRRVGLPLSDPEVSGMLRNLRESIRLQMAGRDHLLVRQCPGFFLYRPLYSEYEFSGGVASEIHTYDQIRKYSARTAAAKRRHVAFVHDEKDVTGLFGERGEGENVYFPDPVHQAAAALNAIATRLVESSGHKTRRPHSPEDRTVSQALQTLGDPTEAAKRIHDEMFPPARACPIGGEQPLDWSSTEAELKNIIQAW